jgi:hypothetical protein
MATQEHAPGSPELSVANTDVEAPITPDISPYLYLEVRRGRTGYPERPVLTRDFLIGSGSECDLRLGGEDIPAAHSLLLIGDDEVRVQWLADAPPLLLNGQPTHEAAICDGDQIGIGRFEFIVHRIQEASAAEDVPDQIPFAAPLATADLMNLVAQAKEQEDKGDVSELSAEELVDRFQADQEAWEDLEEGIGQGEAALLYALAERAENLMEEPAETPAAEAEDAPIDADILQELEKVIEQLSGFSTELDERAARIANQEATQAEAAELLLDAQRELAAQLERFHQQVTESQETPEPKLRKAA